MLTSTEAPGDRPEAPSSSRIERALWVLVGVAVALRLVLILRGWPERGLVADDAFYYFTIAHNVAQGLGPTFDGLAPTNGFHALWLGILVPIFTVFQGNPWLPVRVALVVALLLDIATGIVIYKGLLRSAGRRAAHLGAGAWFLSPLVFGLGLQSMEASVHALCFVLLWRYLAAANGREAGWRPWIVAGALIGLTGWARSDSPLLVGPAFTLAVLLAPAGRFGGLARRAGRVLASAVTALVVLLPWYLWNLSTFGSLVSTSGRLKFRNPNIWGALPNDWDSFGDAAVSSAYVAFSPLLKATSLATQSPIARSTLHLWFVIPLLLGGIGLIVLGLRVWDRSGRPYRLDRVFLAIYVVAHSLFYGVLWRVYGSWYSLPVVAAMIILMAVALDTVLARGSSSERRGAWMFSGMLCVTGVALYVAMFLRVAGEPRGAEAQWVRLFDRIREQIPRGEVVVGAWDAGVAGYVALGYPALTVTNLDGLVNNQVQRAVEEGTYFEYLVETVDVFAQDRRRARMYLTDEEVERLQNYGR